MLTIKRILIIRFRRVGDAVLSTVLCSTLKRTFPEATIDYVLNKGIAPLFEHHPDIDNLITFDNDDLSSTFKYVQKVRKVMNEGKYDMIVDTRATLKTLLFSLFSLQTPFRLGRKKSYTNPILNHAVENRDGEDMVSLTLKLLKPLETHFTITYDRRFRVYTTQEERAAFTEYLIEKQIDIEKPIFICAVATRIPEKMWNPDFMKISIEQILLKCPDAQLIFNYAGSDEKKIAQELFHKLNSHPKIFLDVEAKSIRELAAMISLSDFFFGNEGGPRHIAQALDVPAFALYPPNIEKYIWLPDPSERFQGIESADVKEDVDQLTLNYNEKINLITPEEVWKRLSPMLEHHYENHKGRFRKSILQTH